MERKALLNIIGRCNAINGKKCEFCSKNSKCKEYQELLTQDEIQFKYDNNSKDFEHSSIDEQIKIVQDSKRAFAKQFKTSKEEWVKVTLNEFDKWIKELNESKMYENNIKTTIKKTN